MTVAVAKFGGSAKSADIVVEPGTTGVELEVFDDDAVLIREGGQRKRGVARLERRQCDLLAFDSALKITNDITNVRRTLK